jgi:hypothetical protein
MKAWLLKSTAGRDTEYTIVAEGWQKFRGPLPGLRTRDSPFDHTRLIHCPGFPAKVFTLARLTKGQNFRLAKAGAFTEKVQSL